jgi:hypothetical protein
MAFAVGAGRLTGGEDLASVREAMILRPDENPIPNETRLVMHPQ